MTDNDHVPALSAEPECQTYARACGKCGAWVTKRTGYCAACQRDYMRVYRLKQKLELARLRLRAALAPK
jgi:uncharacterized OB-fold protein